MPPELSESTRNAIRAASEIARESGSESVETEHLLLALLEEDGSAVALLASEDSGNGSGAPVERIAAELQHRMPPLREFTPRGKIPLSPIARQAVAFAAEEAEHLGADWVEPTHLLIGLLRESRGLASEVLGELGYDGDALRQQLTAPAAKPINGSHKGLIETLVDFDSGLTYLERADDARVYVPRNDGWQAKVKHGWEKLFCYLKHPGDDAFHMILNGEVYLQRGDEKYCLDCALRHGFATRDRLYWQRLKREKQTD
jgi:ATP-dependent Clp protease ATP-binding subunit ClpA